MLVEYTVEVLNHFTRFSARNGELYLKRDLIVHYDTSAMKRFLTSVSLQHEPKASDVITLVKYRVSYEILYHEV